MFVHLSDKDRKDLISNGRLTCKDDDSIIGHMKARGFKVKYQRNHPASLPVLLFDCFIMETGQTHLIRSMTPSDAYNRMNEGLKYFYLDWFVRRFCFMGFQRGKHRISIYSKLPHITEIFLDNNFHELKVVPAGGYRGLLDRRKKGFTST